MTEPEAGLYGATWRVSEYAWKPDTFLLALHDAVAQDLACLGGQFQFQLPDGTCEMDWLNADSTSRGAGERWREYVARSVAEVRRQFERRMKETDFFAEADKFEFLRRKRAEGLNILDALWFVAYFSSTQKDDSDPTASSPVHCSP